ncbi:MAG TPA: 2Fe-2S iron-sulfur cluster-binding protein [Burkholderiales bacterium]|nr:2Fe-2S iron-sulfur cluster-binding protein [Burkholderiales bacterium]
MRYRVTVADLGQSVPAQAGETVLSALLSHGVGFAYSCEAGNCGTCKCELVSGEILELEYSEHALSAPERARNIVLACRCRVLSDVVVRRLEAEDFEVHPFRTLRCRVAALERATHDVLRLRLEVLDGGPYVFSAGQFARLAFAFARGEERDYSMANAPGEPVLEFHIRVTDGGSLSARAAKQLQTGDEVRVTGPLGTAYLRARHAGPMLCVAGGTGLAPIRSIVSAALTDGFSHPLHFYFGVRAERDVYAEQELRRWAASHPNLRVHIVLSDPDGAPARDASPRRAGPVTEAVAADLADLAGFKVYVAGPPPMVDAVCALVRARGVGIRDIHADPFYPSGAGAGLSGAR